MSIKTNIRMGDIEFRTPLLTGSGTFGYGDEYEDLVDYSALGGIVTKSLSFEPRTGNPPPRICETSSGGIINSIGLANVGIDEFIRSKVSELPLGKTEVFLSVVGDTVEDFANVVERLEDVESIAGYELNVSCPNVKQGGLSLGGDKEAVTAIVKEVKSLTKRLVSVKFTPHYTLIAPVVQAAVDAGADALTLTNTLVGMEINAETREPLLGNITGGYSGPPLKPVSLAKVWQAAQVVDVPIWASGGIVNGIDAIEYLLAGASALQVGSVFFADPQAPTRILDEMIRYCERHNVSSFRDLIGGLRT